MLVIDFYGTVLKPIRYDRNMVSVTCRGFIQTFKRLTIFANNFMFYVSLGFEHDFDVFKAFLENTG